MLLQSVAEHFAVLGPWIVVDNMDGLRPLVIREMLAAVADQVFFTARRFRLQDHADGYQRLVVADILPDGHAVGDVRVGLHHPFHLVGRNPVTEGVDDVVAAAEEPDLYVATQDLGRTISKLKKEMKRAADKMDFEKAAEYRDRILALERRQIEDGL